MSVYDLSVRRLPGFQIQSHFFVSQFVGDLRKFFQAQRITNQIQIGRFVNRHRGNLFVVPGTNFDCPINSNSHCFVEGFCSCVCLFNLEDNLDLRLILEKLINLFQKYILGASRRDSLSLVSFVDRYGKLILGPVK